MADQLTVQDLLVCFNCANLGVNWNLEYVFVLECKHVMCTACHWQKEQTSPSHALYCIQCKTPRAADFNLSLQIRQGTITYSQCRSQLDFTFVPCRRCPLTSPHPNCLFDHSLYSRATTTACEEVKIEIKVCGKCKVRSEDARCARCKGNLDRLTISKPQKLVIPSQLVFPYGQ